MVKARRRVSRRKGLEKWSKSELSTLKKEYPSTDTSKLAKKLGRSLEAVRFKAKRYGLKKTKVYMESLYAKARKAAPKKRISKKRG
ncbi:MAG: hypothetical protein ACE5IC_01245 [Candidatus Brocadiales bacterium]